MTIDCTVIIPVFNRGEALPAGAASLRAQSLGGDRIEVIYVDDGSNDGRTPALIDEVAVTLPNTRVFHEPPSGSPGRPRNVGLRHARGEYVFFSDHDDWFDPEALERMVGWARRNDSDVVIGKVVAHGDRAVIPRLFRHSRARISAPEAMISLTPHKLFRRAFLDQHQISYPEGKRRLEDHHFVTHAYLHAQTISVYADRVCYHHNHPGEDANFSQTVSDPALYIDSNLEVVELIRRHTEGDSARRDAMLERPIRHEVIKKASPRLMRQIDAGGEAHKHRVLRAALVDAAPPEVIDRMGAFARATAKALLDDDPDAVRRIDEAAVGMALRAEVGRIRAAGRTWQIQFDATVVRNGQPVLFHEVADGWRLDESVLAVADIDRLERESDLLGVDLEILVASRRTSVQWHLPTSYRTRLRGIEANRLGRRRRSPAALTVTGRTTIDLADVGGELIGPGLWDVILRTDTLGVELGNRFVVPNPSVAASLPRTALGSNVQARAFITERRGTLAINVTPPKR